MAVGTLPDFHKTLVPFFLFPDHTFASPRSRKQVDAPTHHGQRNAQEQSIQQNMQDIQSITNQTTDGTKRTAVSIGQLANLAADLKGSVAGFKL